MQSQEDRIESLIDELGLASLLYEIVSICHLKAEHLRSNWQDNASARLWEKDAKKIERLASDLDN